MLSGATALENGLGIPQTNRVIMLPSNPTLDYVSIKKVVICSGGYCSLPTRLENEAHVGQCAFKLQRELSEWERPSLNLSGSTLQP